MVVRLGALHRHEFVTIMAATPNPHEKEYEFVHNWFVQHVMKYWDTMRRYDPGVFRSRGAERTVDGRLNQRWADIYFDIC